MSVAQSVGQYQEQKIENTYCQSNCKPVPDWLVWKWECTFPQALPACWENLEVTIKDYALFFLLFKFNDTMMATHQSVLTNNDLRRMNMKLCKRKVEGLLRKYNERKHNKGATQLLQELEEKFKYERHFNRMDLWHGVWRVYFPNPAWQLKLISSLNSCRHFLESANLNECQLVGIS